MTVALPAWTVLPLIVKKPVPVQAPCMQGLGLATGPLNGPNEVLVPEAVATGPPAPVVLGLIEKVLFGGNVGLWLKGQPVDPTNVQPTEPPGDPCGKLIRQTAPLEC
jgi:hypothetical protein